MSVGTLIVAALAFAAGGAILFINFLVEPGKTKRRRYGS